MYAGLRAIGDLNKQEKKAPRDKAFNDFQPALAHALEFGMVLKMYSETHYRLLTAGNCWDIYPGNMRIIGKPWLELPPEWGLLDMVKATKQLGAKS